MPPRQLWITSTGRFKHIGAARTGDDRQTAYQTAFFYISHPVIRRYIGALQRHGQQRKVSTDPVLSRQQTQRYIVAD